MRCGRLESSRWGGLAAALAAATLCVGVGACTRDQAPAAAPGGATGSASTSTSTSPPASPATGQDGGPGFALTREHVDRFVRYQTRLVQLYDQVLAQREHEKAVRIARLSDGGVADPVKVTLQLFEGKAKAEEAARSEAGLTQEEVRRIEPVVAEVINERSNARGDDVESVVKQYEAMRDKLPEDQRAPVEDQIHDLQADHDYRAGNVEQRQKFGAAAVEAVLAREADLTRLRTEWVKRIAALGR